MKPLGALVVVLLLSGCVTAPNADRSDADPERQPPVTPACPGHWHFMLTVFINNETLPFHNDSFLVPGATELHWDTGSLVHIHPHISIPRCVPLEESLQTLDLALANDTLSVGPKHDRFAGDYTTNETARFVVRAQEWGSDRWLGLVSNMYLAQQLPNGSRLLISFGETTEADIAWQLTQVPPIPDRYRPA